MKKTLLLVLITFFAISIKAQTCESYYPQEVGKTYIYTDYDKKDKVIGITEKTVVEKNTIKGGIEVKMSEISKDKKGKQTSTREYIVKCVNGNFSMDMESFLNQEQMEAYEEMELEVIADDLTIPESAKVGDELNNGEVIANISNNGVRVMSMTVTISDRKVESKESITTNAGTFECLKISSNVNLKMFITFKTTLTEWYAKDIGVVKTESYSNKGKIISKTILTDIK